MAKITIEELFYGDKYGIMGEVVKQVFARQDEFIAAPHTFRELEIVRQTLIAVEKMKKNGDCIAEGELGSAVTVALFEKAQATIDTTDADFGALLICAVRYCLGRHTYMPNLIIGYITPLLPCISDNTLRCMDADLNKPELYGGFGDEKIDEPTWVRFHNCIRKEIEQRRENHNEND